MVTFSVDASDYDSLGFVAINFAGTSQQSGNWYAWRIKRRLVGAASWTELVQYSTPQASYEYLDYNAIPNEPQQWVVIEVTSTDGGQTLVEGTYDPIIVTPAAMSYWLIHPTDSSLSMSIGNPTADSFTEEFEESEILLIGRGRKVDRGTSWGKSGSLTVKFRDKPGGPTGREQREAFSALRDSASYLYLRNPFGDYTKVALFGGANYQREAGVGLREFVVVSVEYKEVF